MATKKQRRRWRKRMLISGMVVCVVSLGVFYGFRRAWITPLRAVRLDLAYPIRQESDFGPESAYQLLLVAAAEPEEAPLAEDAEPIWQEGSWTEALTRLKTQPWPGPTPNGDPPWTAAQIGDMERVLAFYRPRFAILDRALSAPDQQMPTMRSGDDPFFRHLMPTVRLRQALLLSAHRGAAAGDTEGAYRDLGRVARLGNLVTRGTPVIHALIGGSFLRDSGETALLLACRYGESSSALRQAAADYLACAEALEPVAETMRAEAQFALDSVASACASPPSRLAAELDTECFGEGWVPGETSLWFLTRFGWLAGSTRNQIMRNTRALLQHLVAAAEQPYSATVSADLDALVQRLAARRSATGVLLRTWEPVGYLMSCDSVGIWRNSLKPLVALRAQVRATALFLAVKAYEQDHAVPPERLEQLVPDYLPRIPDDPFDGKPLRYLRRDVPGLPSDAWAIYSIGEDFTDDGGTAHQVGTYRGEDGPGPDLVWPSQAYP